MAVRVLHSDEYPTYYITFTCYRWLPLFEMTQGYDLVYRWFEYLRDQRASQVVAYVIMPNHFHGILHFTEQEFDLNKIVGNAKRFMAVFSRPFLEQKLNYIHRNPVQGKWRLVDDFADYEHSSASYYERREIKHFEPTHYAEVT